MSLSARIAKAIARRICAKGKVRKIINRTGRNHKPISAVDLWRQVYRFKETKPARAGTKRRKQRERTSTRWSLLPPLLKSNS